MGTRSLSGLSILLALTNSLSVCLSSVVSYVLEIVRQCVCYSISITINMYGVLVEIGEVFPQPCLSQRQYKLSLEVFKTFMVSVQSKLPS